MNMTDVDITDRFGNEPDPDAASCPWCGKVKRWKGRHADAKHPEKWAAFKEQYERQQGGATWIKRDAE